MNIERLPAGHPERSHLHGALWRYIQSNLELRTWFGEAFPQSRDSTEVLYCFKTVYEILGVTHYQIGLVINPQSESSALGPKIIERTIDVQHEN